MFIKEFEVRWNDIDANGHLANSSYVNYMSHTRMEFIATMGFDQRAFAKHQIGPVVFYEHIYYFKEMFSGKPVKVTLELKGLSEDGMFFEFEHNFYNHKGENCARCEIMGGWIDLRKRKLTGLNEEFLTAYKKVEQAEGFRVLTKEDTRKFARIPKPL